MGGEKHKKGPPQPAFPALFQVFNHATQEEGGGGPRCPQGERYRTPYHPPQPKGHIDLSHLDSPPHLFWLTHVWDSPSSWRCGRCTSCVCTRHLLSMFCSGSAGCRPVRPRQKHAEDGPRRSPEVRDEHLARPLPLTASSPPRNFAAPRFRPVECALILGRQVQVSLSQATLSAPLRLGVRE